MPGLCVGKNNMDECLSKEAHVRQWIIPALLAVAIAGGCSNSKKNTTNPSMTASSVPTNSASLDVPAATYTPPPQPVVYDTPTPQQPVIQDTAVTEASYDTSASAPQRQYTRRSSSAGARSEVASASSGGTKYKIKKGESLWSIAQSHYGNGNKWKQIAAANPGLNPNKIQAGQTITLP